MIKEIIKQKIQNKILRLINNPIYRKYLGVPDGKEIVKVTANSIHWKKNEKEIQAKIYVGLEPHIEQGRKVLRTTTTVAMMLLALGLDKHLVLPLIALTTTNYNVGVGDGKVGYRYTGAQPTQAIWDTVHNAATGTFAYYGADQDIDTFIFILGVTNWEQITRGFMPIDTSALPDDAIISVVTFVGYVKSKYDDYNGDGYDYVAIVQASQPSTSVLAVEDYDLCGNTIDNPTLGSAKIDITGLTLNAYNNFALNATGIGWISLTGYTMLGIREGHDIQDYFPGDPGEVDKYSGISIRDAETTLGSPPYLSVTYTLPSSIKTINGLAKASVKTVNGLAVASVKTWNGLA